LSADAEIIATDLVIEIVAERSLLAVIKQNPHETRAAN